jgi:hypothetical protein
MRTRTGLLAIGGAIALTVGGGTAYATIAASPVSSGVITGCYTNAEVNGSHVFVLQDAGTSCPKGTLAVTWNQTGPAGQNGTNGTAGTAGTNGTNGANGTNGSSLVTSAGAPATACNPGDTDVDLANGEVYTCVAGSIASAGSGAGAGKAGPPANAWSDTNSSIMGPQGPEGQNGTNGTNGTNAAPEFTWTIPCPSGGCAGGDAQTTIPDGMVLTPVAITVSAGTCSDPNPQSVLISDAGGKGLGSITWGAANSSQVDGPDTISAANGNVGPLHYIATGDCAFTITFTFDETQSYS